MNMIENFKLLTITLIIVSCSTIGSNLEMPSFLKAPNGTCWKYTYTRTPYPISVCDENEEKDGALCYPKCISGYKGVGPVCWEGKLYFSKFIIYFKIPFKCFVFEQLSLYRKICGLWSQLQYRYGHSF